MTHAATPLSEGGTRDRRVPNVLRIETVELLHGTSGANWNLVQAAGELGRPCRSRANAAFVATELGLDPEELFQHQYYEFSRGREDDPNLYLTCDPRVAERHAHICSEILEDALRTAFRMLHPRTNPFESPGKERLEKFQARFRAEHGLEPVVLKVRLPLSRVPVPAESKVQNVREWWSLVNQYGPLNTLSLDEPIPAAWATPLAA